MFRTAVRLVSVSVCATILSANLFATPQPKSFDHPLIFEPNHGQAPPDVQWLARGRGYQIFITGNSASFVLFEGTGITEEKGDSGRPSRTHAMSSDAYATMLRMELAGSEAWKATGLEPTGGVSNYYIGNDPKQWRTNVPHYSRIKVADVYPGIDLVFYDNKGDLEYDFIVSPQSDPKQIRLAFDGADRMRVDKSAGDLLLTTSTGAEFRTHHPRVFQQIGNRQVEVAGGYDVLDHGQVAFTLASYDVKRPLLIDPTITFTTFIHGSGQDVATGIAPDNAGNSYVAGSTFSSNIPTVNATLNVPNKVCNPPVFFPSPVCVPWGFVAKLSPTGTILFLTYLGGSDIDFLNALTADATGVYVAGLTFSTDFPQYFNTYKRGGGDVFVTKLSPQGSLIYSSVFGGTKIDEATAIAVDAATSVYVAGHTTSADYPVSFYNYPAPNPPMQRFFGGVRDAFVTKLNPNGLIYDGYSTYLGGSDDDEAEGLAIDASGFAYVTGITFSTNFPKVGPSFGSPRGNGTSTAFVTKLVPGGTGVLYSLTMGGGADEGTAIAVGSTGNAFVAGDTASPAFPTTPGVFQINKPSPVMINNLFNFDGFVAEISPGGLLRSATYLGGTNGFSFPRSIALNAFGEVYVAGDTSTTDFPGPQPITPNPTAGFLVKFPSALNLLSFRIYLGAQINSIAIPKWTGRFPPTFLTPTDIYTAGFRFVPGSDVSNRNNVDAFAVKVQDGPVLTAQ